MRRSFIVVVGLLTGLIGMRCAQAAPAAHPANVALGHYMLKLINHDRALAGLHPLTWQSRLEGVALGHSLDMAGHNYLSHITPAGADPYQRMARAGIHFEWAGENIGYDTGTNRLSMLGAIEVAMMHSTEHRDNLLRGTFHHAGIGIALVGDKVYVTEDFTG